MANSFVSVSVQFPKLGLILSRIPESFRVFNFRVAVCNILVTVKVLLKVFFIMLRTEEGRRSPSTCLSLTVVALLSNITKTELLCTTFS